MPKEKKWYILEEIGEGGQGKVYRVLNSIIYGHAYMDFLKSEELMRSPYAKNTPEKEHGDDGASPPTPKQKRKPSAHDQLKTALVEKFCELTGLSPPLLDTAKQKRSAGALWFGPLVQLAGECDKDVERTARLMGWAVCKMDGDELTISSPNSILKTALSEQARRRRDGAQPDQPQLTPEEEARRKEMLREGALRRRERLAKQRAAGGADRHEPAHEMEQEGR